MLFAKKLLAMLGVIKEGKINNAGYTLFGSDAKIGLKLATYATDNKVTFLDLKLINGNIYNLVGVALDYILSKINWRVEIGSRKRDEIPEIPRIPDFLLRILSISLTSIPSWLQMN